MLAADPGENKQECVFQNFGSPRRVYDMSRSMPRAGSREGRIARNWRSSGSNTRAARALFVIRLSGATVEQAGDGG
jgi:hypothetical protein